MNTQKPPSGSACEAVSPPGGPEVPAPPGLVGMAVSVLVHFHHFVSKMYFLYLVSLFKSQLEQLYIFISHLCFKKSCGIYSLHATNHEGNANQSHNSYHLAPVGTAGSKTSTNSKCWRGCGEGHPCALRVGLSVSAATPENSVDVPQNLKNAAVLRSSNLTSAYLPEENQNANARRHTHPYVCRSIAGSSPDLEATQTPTCG